MEILRDAKGLNLEAAENGVIVRVNNGAAIVSDVHVFNNMRDLLNFIEGNFVGMTKKVNDINDDDKAVYRPVNPYAVENEVFGGGS